MNTPRKSSVLWQTIKRPPWRTVVPALALLLFLGIAYAIWSPGRAITDGRHDREQNAMWLQHGWLGHDSWFTENNKTEKLPQFRDDKKIGELVALLRRNHITDVFPHLCPTLPSGEILPVDDRQTERFLKEMQKNNIRVLPWVGGVFGSHITPESSEQRKVFVQSIAALLRKHPRLAGVHLNIEPWPSGNPEMLVLLEEMRRAMPPGKVLSVAAYPPPTRWHPFPDVHWEEAYFKAVAQRVDQMAVMMYDTSLRDGKMYQQLMRTWTQEILQWTAVASEAPAQANSSEGNPSAKAPSLLLGVATYDDAGSGYHNPKVENLRNGLEGIHAGLIDSGSSRSQLPRHYQGVAIYCEWETSTEEWQQWRKLFAKP